MPWNLLLGEKGPRQWGKPRWHNQPGRGEIIGLGRISKGSLAYWLVAPRGFAIVVTAADAVAIIVWFGANGCCCESFSFPLFDVDSQKGKKIDVGPPTGAMFAKWAN